MRKFIVYTIVDRTANLILYVGKGLDRYGNRPGKAWGRIDVHRKELDKALQQEESQIRPFYLDLKRLVQQGHQIDFEVVAELDDGVMAILKEAELIKEAALSNPNLLNKIHGDGTQRRSYKNRVPMTPEQRDAIRQRQLGKERGSYQFTRLANLDPEQRKIRNTTILKDRMEKIRLGLIKPQGKLQRLTFEQQVKRRDQRAKIHREHRLGRLADEETICQLQVIDQILGLI